MYFLTNYSQPRTLIQYCSDMELDQVGPSFTLPTNMGDLILDDSGILVLPPLNLTGAIPESIGQLTGLTDLDLNDHKFESK